MTIWDKIYKDYQEGGEAWASLSGRIHPFFKEFLNKSNFKIKHVLDIGCGSGNYLKILQSAGFKTDGIDSSETSVEMTKELLGKDSNISCTSMFEFEIPKNKYDLIISVATIHHGRKKQVQELINRIYKALLGDGKIFITVPDLESVKKWETFENNRKIAEGTFVPMSGPEKGLAHSFYKKEEVEELFSKFKDLKLKLDDRGVWVVQGLK